MTKIADTAAERKNNQFLDRIPKVGIEKFRFKILSGNGLKAARLGLARAFLRRYSRRRDATTRNRLPSSAWTVATPRRYSPDGAHSCRYSPGVASPLKNEKN